METRWIWPFELLDKLGEGGMGVVYRARYVGNNKQVAVKLIPDEINLDATLLARFERELEVLKQLHHPNIVHCFGGRCESKQRYYAMEFVPGGTLSDYMAHRGRLTWETAIDFGIQMCQALQHAHEHGVVHRDVKPGNFLLTKNGQLKLSDFGLASVVSEGRLTAAGRTVGTILYMAPEQIRGAPLTHRADLYALGCVLYEMLTAQTPFTGSSAAEVLQRHLKDPIPHVLRIALDCPMELDALICDLLHKDPEQRPVSAAEVAKRLNAILLPSRHGKAAEPSLFSAINTRADVKTVAVSPLKQIKPLESEYELPRVEKKPGLISRTPWIVAGILLFLCTQFWFGWSRTASELNQSEQVWINLLESTEPQTQVLAAKGLGKFQHLSSAAIRRLSDAAASPILEVRLAALKSLSEHADESRSTIAELMRIQKVDDNPLVRAEASLTITAIQQARGSFSLIRYVGWMMSVAFAGVIAASGWWVWKAVQPRLQSI